MGISVNIRAFHPANITDSCSVWNVLSSKRLYHASLRRDCEFGCSQFVLYECLVRPRTEPTPEDERLQDRFLRARESGQFTECAISLADLNDPDILKHRKRLDKGELSSLAFAKRSGQAFLTDDQTARRIGELVIGKNKVQTVPQLLGWLFYMNELGDSDVQEIKIEHERMGRPLSPHFQKVYIAACEARLRDTS